MKTEDNTGANCKHMNLSPQQGLELVKYIEGLLNCWAFTYKGNDTNFWDFCTKKVLFRMLGFPIPEEKF
jgi:hypothetical protein